MLTFFDACLLFHVALGGRASGLLTPNRREVLASNLLVSLTPRPSPPVASVFERPLSKGALDTREYRLVTLQNGLRCLLVSGCDTCGAALEVSAGSFADPPDLAGLGHLTEHALFLGTEFDESEDGFERLAASAGGSGNAFTQGESTRYFFEGPEEALGVVFPTWSQFFAAPLLDEARVRREIGAVDAEHAKNLRNDAFRINYLDSFLRQPVPYSNFATGNRDTLDKPRLMEAMRDYVQSSYVAPNMACVVAGKQSLDDLQSLVSSSGLKDVKKNSAGRGGEEATPKRRRSERFLNDDAASSALLVESLDSQRTLRMAWSLAYDEAEGLRPGAVRGWSDRIAGHVLGHEGPNSLLADLKSADLATDLSAGLSESTQDYRVFEIDVELTKRGLSSWRRVASRCAAFVSAFGEASERKQWPRHVVEEPRKISEVAFEWSEPLPASTLSNVLVGKLRELGQDDAPVDDQLLRVGAVPLVRDDEELEARAQRYAMRLATTKPTISVIGATPTRRVEPIYGTRYDVVEFRESPSAKPEKIFPEPNPYAPSSSNYVPNKVSLPRDSPPTKLFATFWHCAENRGTPRASCLVIARMSPPSTPRDAAISKLWRSVLVERLRDSLADQDDKKNRGGFRSYDAALAGYGWDVSQTQRGVVVSFAGYDDKLKPFVGAGLDAIFSRRIDDDALQQSFSRVKDNLERDLYSASINASPLSRAIAQLTRLLEPNKFDPKDQLDAMKTLTPADIARYHPFDATSRLDALLAGNLDSVQATELAEVVADKTTAKSEYVGEAPHPRLRLCPTCGSAEKLVPIVVESTSSGKEETNVASVVHFQTGGGRRARVLSSIVGALVEPRFYESLRTKQQLGYLVQASARNKEGLAGLVFLVQSGTKSLSPRMLTEKIESFVSDELPTILDKLTSKEFVEVKRGLSNNLLAKSPSLGSLTSTFWDEIVAETQDWSRRKKDAAVLSTITVEDLKAFVQNAMLGPNRRPVAFEVARFDAGGTSEEEGRTIVKDLRAFGDSLPRTPSLLDLELLGDDAYVDFA